MPDTKLDYYVYTAVLYIPVQWGTLRPGSGLVNTVLEVIGYHFPPVGYIYIYKTTFKTSKLFLCSFGSFRFCELTQRVLVLPSVSVPFPLCESVT